MKNTVLQLDLFRERLPKKPYHTDELVSGVRINRVLEAVKHRYIQPNGPTHLYWLVFDMDRPDAGIHWDLVNAPAPNIVVINRSNGHAHYLYGLEIAVRTAPDGEIAPLRYAAAIQNALRDKLDADIGYSGLICKNPLHSDWRVQVWEPESYDLDWLAEYVDLSAYKDRRKHLPDYGLGRNCNLFENLRRWAYKAIRQGWPDYEQWLKACEERAEGYNVRFNNPLPLNEVRHVSKSVAKWTYRHFSPSAFSAWQAKQGAKGGRVGGVIGGKLSKRPTANGQKKADLLPLVEALKAEGLSNRAIATELGIGSASVCRYLKEPSKVIQ